MHTKSENRIRGRQPMAIYGQHDAQREKVKQLLDKHVAKPPEVVSGEMNKFVVTLCRISAGELDEEDNLRGALKHIKDAIARWLGFKNDNNKERLQWRFQQQLCPRGFYAVRVTIDDASEGDERSSTVGNSPPVLGEIIEAGDESKGKGLPARPGEKRKGKKEPLVPERITREIAAQRGLTFRRVYAAFPWDLPVDAADDDIVATEVLDLEGVADPPEQVQFKIPQEHLDRMLRKFGRGVRGLGPGPGPKLVFERLAHDDPALGGQCWLYVPIEP